MKTEIKYIELKSGYSDDGPAWIGQVSYSKSGRTIYFDGKAFQSLGGTGTYANYFDIETDEEYWISGIKKDMTDRHWAGGGKIMVEKRILPAYLELVGKNELNMSEYELTEVQIETPIVRIYQFENEQIEQPEFDQELHFKTPAI